MTRKFRRTVKSVVLDGVITSEEKAILKKVAKEENVSDTDAEIYITKELKKRKVKLEKGDGWWKKNGAVVFGSVVTLIGILVKKGK